MGKKRDLSDFEGGTVVRACQTVSLRVLCFPSSRAHIWLVPVPVLICDYQFPALCL